ncbi:MAG: helix-turn-helix transcriptional regulator [Clostridia bacterium]|nr:helix-turn-helix transcriptional regulator [Clostridia bacterium]
MTLGEQIREARERKNLSQEELAEQVGVSRQAVSKWENDTAVPHGGNREVLSSILELTDLAPEPVYKTPVHAWIGWALAAVLLLLIVCMSIGVIPFFVFQKPTEDVPAFPVESISAPEEPSIKRIRFYDSDEKEVEADALWYNAAAMDSILIEWEGGALESIKMFAVPTGTETLEQTELLLTKMITEDGEAALLRAETLQNISMAHVYFELDFGDITVISEDFNIFFDESILKE